MIVGEGDADEDWYFDGIVSIDEVASSGVRKRLKDIYCLCEDEEKTVPTSVIEVILLSLEVVETNRDNAEFTNHNIVLERKL